MNNNNRNNSSNSSSNSQPWMMTSDHGPEPFDYMISRPPGSVLPTLSHPPHHSSHPMQPPPLTQEESVSPPAQAHEFDNSRNHKGANRAVIPSKRAAQNRAAQKAFRQRREQYIKDLEIKAKEMEDWQEEMDKLKKENSELRERIMTLENQVSILTGGDPSKIPAIQQPQQSQQSQQQTERNPVPVVAEEAAKSNSTPMLVERSVSLPNTSVRTVNEEVRRGSASPVGITSSPVKRSHNESRLRHEQQQNESEDNNNSNKTQQEGTFAPVPLRAPNQTGFKSSSYHPNDHTPALIGNDTTIDTKRRKLDDSSPSMLTQNSTQRQQLHIGQAPIASNTSTNYIHNTLVQNNNPPHSLPPPSSNSNSNPLLLPIQSQQQHQQQQPQNTSNNDFWSSNIQQLNAGNNSNSGTIGDFDLDFDFDPFFEEEFGPTITNSNDFLPNANSGQVLDDLFAMLQTRQRPQIPLMPTDENLELNNSGSNNSSSNIM